MSDRVTRVGHWLHRKLRPNFGGLVGGMLFFCLSFTPSLLPRGYVLQGMVSGLSFATGYGLGVLASYLYHKLPRKRRTALTHTAKLIILLALTVLAIGFIIAGLQWQDDIRKLTEAAENPPDYALRVVLVAAVLALLLVWAGRGTRRLARYFARKLSRLPPKAARFGGAVLATLLLLFLLNGVIFKAAFGLINYSFGLANKGTPPNIYQPQTGSFSGTPASYIGWNTLGEKGREFVASAPSQSDIQHFSVPEAANHPARLYAGLESAPDLKQRVDLLVRELGRISAQDRAAVLIAIPTGSGGLNAKSVQSVEYLYNGDVATLGIQYSYLPSWLSFLADQETARQTGKALTEAVYDWWSTLPSGNRPALLLYGESLGTLGADGAFSGPADIRARMHGVLLAGPPNANRLWTGIVDNRDPGTREVLPTYQQGKDIRFSDGSHPFKDPAGKPWGQSRTGILQNASDPVIWASLSLFYQKPDWLREPRGSDVLANMRWYPFVTGWQTGLDLPFAFGATPGHGHRYDIDLPAAWTAVLDKPLSPDKTNQLRQIIDTAH
jgi:uncharacterized membrane protein